MHSFNKFSKEEFTFGGYTSFIAEDGGDMYNLEVYSNSFEQYSSLTDQMKSLFLTIGHELVEIGLEYNCYKGRWNRHYFAERWEQMIGAEFDADYFETTYSKSQIKSGKPTMEYLNKYINWYGLPTHKPNFP